MPKLFTTTHTFQHPFDRVTSAFWRKYPNDLATHVKAIDVTERTINADGQLVTNRIMTCENAIPPWLTAVGLPPVCHVAETSIVDPQAQEMVVKSRNLTGSSLIVIEETCTYTAQNESATHYKQQAKITSFLPFISGKFEQFTVNNMNKKSAEGLKTIENLCERIQNEGVLSLLGIKQTPNTQ